MSVQQVLRKLGQWSLQLRADAPPGVLASLSYFGRVAIVAGPVNPTERGDELLTLARYVGVLRSVEGRDQITLSGSGMAFWLGDETDAGSILEPPGVTISGQTFADSIRALLPPAPADCVREGTLTSIAGTYSGTHEWQTRRAAIDYVCDVFGGDWRVNGNATLDAGPASTLFRSGKTVIARRDVAGYDMDRRAIAGDLEATRDVSQYTTRVVVVADGFHIGDADAASVPYLDPFGNPVAFTRVADEQDGTEAVNADVRAALILAKYSGPRRQVRLSVDDFDVAGDVQPGDTVWVWDPETGLTNTANELYFRGGILNPEAVRVLSVTWPVTSGYTVAFRNGDGTWVDLTPWVEWEDAGGGEVEVADTAGPALTSSAFGSLGTVVSGTGTGGGAGDASIPDIPTFGTFSTSSYQPADGLARSAVKVTWTQPLNTDGSTITDGDHYEVRYRPTGTTEWQVSYAGWDQTSLTVTNLPPSTGFDWQIRAVDYAAPINYGAWSSTTTYSTSADTTAPGTPAAPTVAASLIAVQIKHTLGLAAGGTYNLPLDMDHLEVHVGTSSGFTTSTATLAGKLQATGAMVTGTIPAVGTFAIDTLVSAGATAYVKVVAVDRTGNRSPSSAAASATAQLIDSAHISDLTAAKITAGTMSAAVILSGSIKTGTSGGRVEIDATGVRAYDSTGFNTAELKSDGTFTLNNGNTLNGILINNSGLEIYNGSGQVLVDLDAAGSFLMRSSLSGARVELDMSGLRLYNGGGTQTVNLDAATGNAAFTGTITGSTITGSTLQTGASGGRVVIGAGATQRIDFYSSAGDQGYIQADSAGSDRLAVVAGGGSSYLWLYNGTTSINTAGGVVAANSTGWTGQSTTGTAYVTGSGSTLTVDAGSSLNIGTSNNPTITIGNAFGGSTSIASVAIGIGNAGPATTGTALVRASGQLRPQSSSLRYKKDIEDVSGVALEHLTALRPVTYRDKHGLDDSGGVRRYFGLIAEEIADGPLDLLVFRNGEGQPESLMYDRLAALLVLGVRELADRVAALEAA